MNESIIHNSVFRAAPDKASASASDHDKKVSMFYSIFINNYTLL